MKQNAGKTTIKVLIVDDHPTLRRGLRALLSPHHDLEVVGEADNGGDAVQAAVTLIPDVILLDIKMSGDDGVRTTSELSSQVPHAKIIILTAFDNEDYLLGAFQAGASAYLLKSSADETMVETIRQVHQGKYSLSAPLMDSLLRQFRNLAQIHSKVESDFSEEEIKVLRLIADGATNTEIAQEMYWSGRTTKRKVEEIIARLGARNRAQAAVEAVRKGFI